ncbi:MAG: hypothetical protein FJ318_00580 [SAR202 cluster bacterium]|nr:hypothetical protein [SAR202 cluster bacterium]
MAPLLFHGKFMARDEAMSEPATFRTAFKDASRCFVDTVARIPAGRWQAAGLGEWTVRETVGHTCRAYTTLLDGLGAGATAATITSPSHYYRVAQTGPDADQAGADRGRQAAAHMDDEPLGYVRELAARAETLVDATPDTAIATVRFGTMRFADFLVTRASGLLAHALDIARAAGVDLDPPASATRATFDILRELAIDDGVFPSIVFALTGRGSLHPRFNLLGQRA